MCGIAGLFNVGDERCMMGMLEVLARRGPDGSGIWRDSNLPVCLGHTRLAIQDLSDAGSQPMLSNCGRYVLVLNGEIYNHLDLRKNDYLSAKRWRGRSDTETVVELIAECGLEFSLSLLVGMFAAAVFDRQAKILWLVRDRLGEKPLYWSADDNSFAFASDIDSIKKLKKDRLKISESALFSYFQYGYVPAPFSIYEGVNKLEPGKILKFSLKLEGGFEVEHRSYWDFSNILIENNDLNYDHNITNSDIKNQIFSTVSGQLISDAPVGVFLSGGIDSSLIAAVAAEVSEHPIKTFSVGFPDSDFNEAPYAKIIADYIGSDHRQIEINEKDCLDAIPKMAEVYSEPFADSSQIPTYLLCQFAAESVKVALTGDGGDEVFAGYNRHIFFQNNQRFLKNIPEFFGKIAMGSMKYGSLHAIRFFLQNKSDHSNNAAVLQNLNDKMYKACQLFGKDSKTAYDILTRYGSDFEIVNHGSFGDKISDAFSFVKSPAQYAMARDTVGYLPDDILVKVDRAAMYNSLETRAPFLDHRLISLAWKIQINRHIARGKGKLILRTILQDYVPKQAFERPKAGFAIPLSKWLRGPLRSFVGDTFSSKPCQNDDLINSKALLRMFDLHCDNALDLSGSLWAALMYLEWKRLRS